MKGKRERNLRRKREKVAPEKFGPGEKNLSKIDIKELFSDVMNILNKFIINNINILLYFRQLLMELLEKWYLKI